ncbi:MliC family protein [Brevundimonas sp.]|uniref:MliC family protein n=1 Tax=Brevundimonas sp. TaxID=1871086 RepID=UPI0025DBB7E4|nr:MliC family protein [Brevundimonas sp.]
MRPWLTFALATGLSLAACDRGPPDDMPQTGAEARERAVDARVAHTRTGAEIQEQMTNRIVRAEYACLNGERLSVVFDNPREMATVRMLDGTAIDLRQERAADGIWYRADRYELRGSGADATWRAAGREETTCRAIG